MPRKTTSRRGTSCRVTFELPPGVPATAVAVLGDFNGWSPDAHPLARRRDGRFSATVSLPAGATYRYRYLLDGARWENDPAADGYVPNPFGGDDSVVVL